MKELAFNPLDEAHRLEVLEQFDVLDSLPEQALDDLTAIAAQVCQAPIALISLVAEHRQWFKSRIGVEVAETPRDDSFCVHLLNQSELLIVPDTTQDERFSQNPLVTGKMGVRFYAGAPLISREHATLGSLCVLDRSPRTLTGIQERTLKVLARQVMTHLELRRHTQALRLSERRFSNAFKYAPIGMALVSNEGRWLKVNQALCTLLGYSFDEMAGRTFQEMTHPDDLKVDMENVRDLVEGKIDACHVEKRYIHKLGHPVWVLLGVSMVRDKQSKPLYFIAQIQDITASREVLARQQELTEKAQAAEKAKSEFLAIMSHEIRTPMNGVIGMTNILADTELNELQRDCVSTIMTSGESLLTVINDILDYSKIEAGRLRLENLSFDLRQCVENVLDLFATEIHSKRLEVIYFLSPEIPSNLVGDAMRLRQILVNVIGNAIKFTPQGEISLHVEWKGKDEKGCHLLFSIADTGIGIPKEGVERLFQAFQQVDSSTTRNFGGTGLGLVISRRLTEVMGGTMWVESEVGVGSTFFFTMVLGTSTTKTQDPSVDTKALKARSVLVVDDNATNRRILEHQLKIWEMNVVSVATGQEVMALLPRQKFDVVLMDLQMPVMDGVTLAREIRGQVLIPLILLSSSGEIMVSEEGDLFQSQVPKPVKQSHLLQALLKAVGNGGEFPQKAAETRWDDGLGARHPLRILLAEDNSVNQKVGRTILSRFGYTADLAINGKRVLEALEKSTYDLILMDIQMPEMNGMEAMRLIRKRYGEASPVMVALTAEALSGDKERFLSSGFDDYLSKPLQAKLLQEVLAKVSASRPLGEESHLPSQPFS